MQEEESAIAIADDHNCTRLIRASKIIKDSVIEDPPGAAPVAKEAFLVRDADKETGLSVNWIDYFETSTFDQSIEEIWAALGRKMELDKKHRLAVLNVGTVRDYVRQEAQQILSVQHHPEMPPTHPTEDPSHAGIHGYSPADVIIATLIGLTVKQIIEQA